MLLKIACATALLAFASTSAFAAGGGGNSDPVKPCPKGEIWVKEKKKCVKRHSSEVTDEDVLAAGRQLAEAGDYETAIDVLHDAANGEDPRILNYIGFSHRKAALGRHDTQHPFGEIGRASCRERV